MHYKSFRSNTILNNNTSFHEQTWCDNNQMLIDCNRTSNNFTNNNTINILCAFYGLHPSMKSSCGFGQKFSGSGIPVCYFDSSMRVVKKACDGRASCNLTVGTVIFIDPCSNMSKGLFVQWSCTSN